MIRASGALVAALVMAPAAHAAPRLTVRAHTRLTLESIQRTEDGARITGRLVEPGSQAGIASALVMVSVAGTNALVQTEDGSQAGLFHARVALPHGPHDLSLHFAGTDLYTAASLEDYHFDLDKATLALSIEAPAVMDATDAHLELRIQAHAAFGPQALVVSVAVADRGRAARPIARLRTGESGFLPRADLGAPGDKELSVAFAGNDAFNPAHATVNLRLRTQTILTETRIPEGPLAHEATLVATGRLLGSEGQPVGGQSVGLMAQGRHVADALTNAAGYFHHSVPAADFAPGPHTLHFEYTSTAPWRNGARSVPYTLLVLPPRPVPLGYLLLAFATTLSVVLAFVLSRTRPWRWLAARRAARSPRPGPLPKTKLEAPPSPSGLRLSRPGLLSTLRRPADHGLSGHVADAVRHTALAGATVTLSQAAEPPVTLETDAAGAFAREALQGGLWTARVQAPGYLPEQFYVTIPHRGELRGVRVDLAPIKEKVFALYREVAARLLPHADLWGVWTPREILDHVKERRPAGALGALTQLVEETYFSARVPDEALLPDVVAKLQAARAEAGIPLVDSLGPRR